MFGVKHALWLRVRSVVREVRRTLPSPEQRPGLMWSQQVADWVTCSGTCSYVGPDVADVPCLFPSVPEPGCGNRWESLSPEKT